MSTKKEKAKSPVKSFDAVKSMREIRDKMSKEITDMDFEQLKAYFAKIRSKEGKKPR